MKAYRVFEDGRFGSGRYCEMGCDQLDPGDVVMRVAGRQVVDFSI